MDRNNMKAVVH